MPRGYSSQGGKKPRDKCSTEHRFSLLPGRQDDRASSLWPPSDCSILLGVQVPGWRSRVYPVPVQRLVQEGGPQRGDLVTSPSPTLRSNDHHATDTSFSSSSSVPPGRGPGPCTDAYLPACSSSSSRSGPGVPVSSPSSASSTYPLPAASSPATDAAVLPSDAAARDTRSVETVGSSGSCLPPILLHAVPRRAHRRSPREEPDPQGSGRCSRGARRLLYAVDMAAAER